MKNFILQLVFCTLVLLILCTCSSEGNLPVVHEESETNNIVETETNQSDENIVSPVDEQDEQAMEDETTVKDQDVYDPGEILYGCYEYTSPYLYTREEIETPKYDLYWQLERNAIILINKVACELADKRWEHINFERGFPDRYHGMAEWISETEKNSHLYCVEGKILEDTVYVIVTLVFSEDNPEGQISRVIYTSKGGRGWNHKSAGYGDLEIVDAYNFKLWQNMTAY